MNLKLSILLLQPPPEAVSGPFWHSLSLQSEQRFELLLMSPEKPMGTGPYSFHALASRFPERFRWIPAAEQSTLSPAQQSWQSVCALIEQVQSERLLFWDTHFQMHPETVAEHLRLPVYRGLALGSNSFHPSQALSCFALAAQHLRLFPAARFYLPGAPELAHFQDFALHNLSMSRSLWPTDWQPRCQSRLFQAWELALHFQSQPLWALPEARAQALQPLQLETAYAEWQQACQQDAAAFCQRFKEPWPALRFWPTAWHSERDEQLLSLAPQRLQYLSQSQHEQRVPLEPQGLYAEAFVDWEKQLLQLWQAVLAQQLDSVSPAQQTISSALSSPLALWPWELVPSSKPPASQVPDAEHFTDTLAAWFAHKLHTGIGLEVGGQELLKWGISPWQELLTRDSSEKATSRPVQLVVWLYSESSLLNIWQHVQPHLSTGAWLVFAQTQDPVLQAFESLLACDATLRFWGENASFRIWTYTG